MRRILVLAGVVTLCPTPAMARDNVVPANPMTQDAVQVPLSFISYERRTDHTQYAVGAGFNIHSWLLGSALRYHVTNKWENQLLRERGPADALELEVTLQGLEFGPFCPAKSVTTTSWNGMQLTITTENFDYS